MRLWMILDSESTYMPAEPGERGRTDLPALSYRVVPYARVRHRGRLMTGVRSSHQGRGFGLREKAIAESDAAASTRRVKKNGTTTPLR